jgi:putative transposase
MCEVLGVSRSGYHGWGSRAPSNRDLSDAWLTSRITEIHERARGVYGSRRVQAELRLGQDIQVSRRRVRRLMRAAGISGLVKVKRGRTTIRVPGVRVADDLVERKFRPDAPNMPWVADITRAAATEQGDHRESTSEEQRSACDRGTYWPRTLSSTSALVLPYSCLRPLP